MLDLFAFELNLIAIMQLSCRRRAGAFRHDAVLRPTTSHLRVPAFFCMLSPPDLRISELFMNTKRWNISEEARPLNGWPRY